MQRVKGILRRLREQGQRLSDFDVLIVAGDGDVIGCRGRVSALALSKHPGQALLLPVAMWRKQAENMRGVPVPLGLKSCCRRKRRQVIE
jgi:hypothetical protein